MYRSRFPPIPPGHPGSRASRVRRKRRTAEEEDSLHAKSQRRADCPRLDRLVRSTRDLLNTLAAITGPKAGFVCPVRKHLRP